MHALIGVDAVVGSDIAAATNDGDIVPESRDARVELLAMRLYAALNVWYSTSAYYNDFHDTATIK